MADKRNLWAVLVVPWTPNNIYIFGSFLLVLTFLPFAITWGFDRFRPDAAAELPDWWLFVPMVLTLFVMLILYIINILVERAAAKLSPEPVLRSHCLVVHGLIQMPGLVQIDGNRLTIQPIIGKPASVPLAEISHVSEHHFYNGSPYLGKTAFFKLTVPESVSKKSRLGFAVPDAEPWRKLLPVVHDS
jgi:hypothetical protein